LVLSEFPPDLHLQTPFQISLHLLDLLLDPDDGSSMFLRKNGEFLPSYTAPHPNTWHTSRKNFRAGSAKGNILFSGILAVITTMKINQSNFLFHLITAISFGPHLGPSLGSFIKCGRNM
jgi:hypothetical protein